MTSLEGWGFTIKLRPRQLAVDYRVSIAYTPPSTVCDDAKKSAHGGQAKSKMSSSEVAIVGRGLCGEVYCPAEMVRHLIGYGFVVDV